MATALSYLEESDRHVSFVDGESTPSTSPAGGGPDEFPSFEMMSDDDGDIDTGVAAMKREAEREATLDALRQLSRGNMNYSPTSELEERTASPGSCLAGTPALFNTTHRNATFSPFSEYEAPCSAPLRPMSRTTVTFSPFPDVEPVTAPTRRRCGNFSPTLDFEASPGRRGSAGVIGGDRSTPPAIRVSFSPMPGGMERSESSPVYRTKQLRAMQNFSPMSDASAVTEWALTEGSPSAQRRPKQLLEGDDGTKGRRSVNNFTPFSELEMGMNLPLDDRELSDYDDASELLQNSFTRPRSSALPPSEPSNATGEHITPNSGATLPVPAAAVHERAREAQALENDETASNVTEPKEACPPAEPAAMRWCNFMYTTRCPFSHNHASSGMAEPCKFMHLDAFVELVKDERTGMPNLMLKHMRGFLKELHKIVDSRARKTMNSWSVLRSMGGCTKPLSPYLDTVLALRKLGWRIPEAAAPAPQSPDPRKDEVKLAEAPYAGDIAAILGLCASSMHYDLEGCDDVLLQTIALVFTFEAPGKKKKKNNSSPPAAAAKEQQEKKKEQGKKEVKEAEQPRQEPQEGAGSAEEEAPAATGSSRKKERRAAHFKRQKELRQQAKANREKVKQERAERLAAEAEAGAGAAQLPTSPQLPLSPVRREWRGGFTPPSTARAMTVSPQLPLPDAQTRFLAAPFPRMARAQTPQAFPTMGMA
eukprot:TRINITY_DN3068_c2_g2_i1.p1 TRINITY_DN3068_c2_g2~~TRINITY_DN3068_c2_g2_i1.p1  ORF type:complete len:726 (+),score=289.24 TRINITY_DN3068_c2_g2_i1:62-2179(+)